MPVAFAHSEGTVPNMGEAVPKPTTALLADGRTLTGKDGHGCIACHDISGVVGGGTRGTDLALVPNRIRRDWFDRWMDNPQRLAPGTHLPAVDCPGGEEIFLLSGSLRDEYGNYGAGAWIRNPAGFRRSLESQDGATYWVKRGHLRPAP